MKKINISYLVTCYGIAIAFIIGLFALSFSVDSNIIPTIAYIGIIVIFIFFSPVLNKNMEKKAAKLVKDFPYEMSFRSNNGIFYFNPSQGRAAVVWKYNPFELQEIDVSKVSDIRTHDGKQLNGTFLVSCQFKLNGKKIKIYTLRVSRRQLSMRDPRVLEAISKADKIGEVLKASKEALQ